MAQHASALAWPVVIDTHDGAVSGDLTVPDASQGLVIFAHGSGSSRHSPRNRAVADALVNAQLATLLVDLLTEAEERIDDVTAELRFDIPFLARRVVATIDWAGSHRATAELPVGLFGASTGAAAAIIAAAERPKAVQAIVSRGGRPDLAEAALDIVTASTLLIVGGHDAPVIELNREALARMTCVRKLQIVPGATHLFEERGALETVARLATDWFLEHLPARRP